MASVLDVIPDLKEAIKILEAYQFPREERAELALKKIEKAKAKIIEWKKED